MVTLDTIRSHMEVQLKEDKELHVVEVNADTLDEALSDAAVQLETKVANLEYEVVERGSDGFLKINKRPWTIRAFLNPAVITQKKKKKHAKKSATEAVEEKEKIIVKNGAFYVHRFETCLCLKVVLPDAGGKAVNYGDVIVALNNSDTLSVDEELVGKLVESGTKGEYEPVGTYQRTQAADSLLTIDIAKDESIATATVTAPGVGGADVSVDQIKQALSVQGVVACLEEEKIIALVDTPVYNTPCEVAATIQPVNGRDAYIAYNFETDSSKLKLKETTSGQVDFKELNRIQNVVKGQALAQKIPAENGKSGKTLSGRYLEATNGKDIKLPLGKNVEVDKDGCTIIASVNGQVLLSGDKINVEPVLEVDGVNIKTGNITFLGAVVVKGNVDDGFSIKASGNIEIYGTVGKSNIEADGDIIVSQGIFGRNEGFVKAGKSLWAKFIQTTKVDVGEYIVVSDSIMNSDVIAMKRIILQGKKAHITGGHLFATEEISAKTIGSVGGAETILEVGFDPKLRQRLAELQTNQGDLMKKLEEVELNIFTLENQKSIRKSLPKDKEDNLQKLKEEKQHIADEAEEMSDEIRKIQNRLRDLKVGGKVKCSGVVHAGVKVYVRDVMDEVHSDVRAVTFFYEGGFVQRGKYEEPLSKDIKAPDGYSSN